VLDLAALRQEQIGGLVALDSPVQEQVAVLFGAADLPRGPVGVLFGMAALRQEQIGDLAALGPPLQEQAAALFGLAAHWIYSLRP